MLLSTQRTPTVSLRELVSSLQYIDSSKACVWGWSYGGYLTGLVLAEVGLLELDRRSLVVDNLVYFCYSKIIYFQLIPKGIS